MSKPRELERFELAQEQLHAALEPLQPLIDEYNAALEQAGAAVRGRGMVTEDFKVSREFDEYDVEKLFELMGQDKFLELGGTMTTQRVLGIDKYKFKSFVESGKVPQGVVDQVVSHKRQYSTPKPLKLK